MSDDDIRLSIAIKTLQKIAADGWPCVSLGSNIRFDDNRRSLSEILLQCDIGLRDNVIFEYKRWARETLERMNKPIDKKTRS